MATYDATPVRLQLFANGYKPTPNLDKRCVLKGWASRDFAESITPGTIASWAQDHRGFKATGLLVRDGLMPIDLDISDNDVLNETLYALYKIAPEVHDQAPWRTGKPPKLMVFARWQASTAYPDMFVREASDKFIDADGRSHMVEVFGGAPSNSGGSSKQVGAFGPHSYEEDEHGKVNFRKVLHEYSWEADLSPKDMPLSALPVMTQDQVWALLKAFEEIALAAGWIRKAAPKTASGFVYDITEASRFNVQNGPDGLTYDELCAYDIPCRVDGSFIDGSTHRRDKCLVDYCKAKGEVGVYDHESSAWHLPKSAEPATLDGLEPLSELAALAGDQIPKGSKRSDFYAFLPKHEYLFVPTGALWPAASINAVIDKIVVGQKAKRQTKKQIADGEAPEMIDVTIPPSLWLDRHRAVHQMGWAPGHPQTIDGKLATEGGWVNHPDSKTFNLYKAPPPRSLDGNPAEAAPWLALVRLIYPDHAEHILNYLAHCIQFPGVKINHALVLVGTPGIGKDTLLEPIGHGLGEWNFKEIRPMDVVGDHNDYRRCLVLRISETHDLGDTNRYAFYNATKTMLAAPPSMARINTKYVPQYYIPNVHCTIMTTNHGTDGLYLVADDRRHYVAGTDLRVSDHAEGYLPGIWGWYAAGGLDHVVAYLHEHDLTGFDAKAPPAKTPEFWRLVDTGVSSAVPELRDAIEAIGGGDGAPKAFTLDMLRAVANTHYELHSWLSDRRHAKEVPHRMDDCGYMPVRCSGPADGLWKINKRRVVIYASRELSGSERYQAAEALQKRENGKVVQFPGVIDR